MEHGSGFINSYCISQWSDGHILLPISYPGISLDWIIFRSKVQTCADCLCKGSWRWQKNSPNQGRKPKRPTYRHRWWFGTIRWHTYRMSGNKQHHPSWISDAIHNLMCIGLALNFYSLTESFSCAWSRKSECLCHSCCLP